jgi:lipopolysaccharide biosynthesis glycosyltransferase
MSNDAGKRPLAIVMGITADLAFAAATVLRGLRRFPPADDYDVILHHGGVRGSELELLGGLHPCRFERYRCPARIRRLIPPATLRAFSDQAFAKYECFDLLTHYSQVLWLDADVLVRGDTTALLERGRGGAGFAREDKPLRFNFSGDIEGFNMSRPFYNTGVFVLSDCLPGWREAKAWLLEATVRHADRVVLSEQGILNLWLQYQRIEPIDLLPEYNVFRHRPGAAAARIVHAVGHHKPWMDFTDTIWNEDYRQWLAIGGSPCPVWKCVRFMANRHPKPWSSPPELARRATEIAGFLYRRTRLASGARAMG